MKKRSLQTKDIVQVIKVVRLGPDESVWTGDFQGNVVVYKSSVSNFRLYQLEAHMGEGGCSQPPSSNRRTDLLVGTERGARVDRAL